MNISMFTKERAKKLEWAVASVCMTVLKIVHRGISFFGLHIIAVPCNCLFSSWKASFSFRSLIQTCNCAIWLAGCDPNYLKETRYGTKYNAAPPLNILAWSLLPELEAYLEDKFGSRDPATRDQRWPACAPQQGEGKLGRAELHIFKFPY